MTRAAMIICDMWDTTQCVSAARRVVELAPRIDAVAARLRPVGALIIHAPAGCMDFYADTAARQNALRAPPVASPVPVDWNEWNSEREAALSPSLADDTPCSCEPGEPCTAGGPPYPWTRQIASIAVLPQDAVTDDGHELLALLEQHSIDLVVMSGVHLNRCVLGRPYGIRQLVYWGKHVVLCRDLTDAYHRDPHGHQWGNDRMIEHIQRHWCPAPTSDDLLNGPLLQISS